MNASREAIELPELSIEIAGPRPSFALMAAGGRPPVPEWLSKMKFCSEYWAVDRGVECLRGAGMIPDRLIGDCDSARAEDWEWAMKNGARAERFPSEKDLTDLQLAMDIFVREHEIARKKIILTGAFGGRFDHLWSAILSFVNCGDESVPFCAADGREGLLILRGGESVSLSFKRPPAALSLLSLTPRCTGVSMDGARWPLSNAALEFARPYAVSNRTEGEATVVSCAGGMLGVYWLAEEAAIKL